MRKRSIPVLLLAMAAWLVVWRIAQAVMLTAVGYKIGGPLSASSYLRLTGFVALLSSFVGIVWLTVDFLQWIRGRER